MRKTVLMVLFLAVAPGLAFIGCAQGQGDNDKAAITIKMSYSTPDTDQTGLVAIKFKELVEGYSNGQIEVENYPMMQLGTEQENVQDVASGSLEAAIVYTGNFKPFAPSSGVLMLPYIFKNNQEAWNGMDSIAVELRDRVVAESGTRIVGYFDKGFRYLTNSQKPVKTIDDLEGLKIRVSKVDIAIETFRAWGLEPVPMAWAEVPTALQQKVIDGQENPYVTIDSHKFYETQTYLTEIHYQIWTGPIIVNDIFYKSLSTELQEAIDRAGTEAARFGRDYASTSETNSRKIIEEKGMTILGPPEDEEIWQQKAVAIWPMFYDSVGGEEWVRQAMSLMGR